MNEGNRKRGREEGGTVGGKVGVEGGGGEQEGIGELLSDRHRTEKLFPAFELLHARAFPERPSVAPDGNRPDFFFTLFARSRVLRARSSRFFRAPCPGISMGLTVFREKRYFNRKSKRRLILFWTTDS